MHHSAIVFKPIGNSTPAHEIPTNTHLNTLRLAPLQLTTFIFSVLAACEPLLPHFTMRELSNVLHALARMGQRPPAPWALAALERGAELLPAASAQQLGSGVWALGKLGVDPGPQWLDDACDRSVVLMAQQEELGEGGERGHVAQQQRPAAQQQAPSQQAPSQQGASAQQGPLQKGPRKASVPGEARGPDGERMDCNGSWVEMLAQVRPLSEFRVEHHTLILYLYCSCPMPSRSLLAVHLRSVITPSALQRRTPPITASPHAVLHTPLMLKPTHVACPFVVLLLNTGERGLGPGQTEAQRAPRLGSCFPGHSRQAVGRVARAGCPHAGQHCLGPCHSGT